MACTIIPVPTPVTVTPTVPQLVLPTTAGPQVGKFGEAVETPGKVKIEVSKPEPYQPKGLDEEETKHPRAVVFTVTITNNTGKTLTNLHTLGFGSFTEQGGKETVEVETLHGSDLSTGVPDLPPGKLTKLRLAYGLSAKPGSLRLKPILLPDHAEVSFEGEV
ncbi:hypothetical protein N8J89_40505 [Crossiella sp. CA-258035]|uniref:hypothetical protein n=1 Tax=Crossiella sp. CA-258035 TaxID=2981138 RepID=UPI0024BC89C3|nr:hypothetical protein [Crossiella sp. CA-258035]WHT19301.1 hypothetical protein N8J89_40505 [Crossiella sp. CA-258035]